MSVVGEVLRRKVKEAQAPFTKCVRRTDDFRRIEALPRRTHVEDLSEAMTQWLRRQMPIGGVVPSQEMQFAQAWALQELFDWDGAWGWIEVGGGKTLICLMAPTVVQRAWDFRKELDRAGLPKKVRAGYIVPANLRNEKTLKAEVPFYSPHWEMYDWNEENVVSYETLGRESAETLLERKMWNLIILDESHKMKNKTAAVTKRILRYIEKYPDTVVISVSASAFKDSIREIAHVIAISHGVYSPLPLVESELQEWGSALDHGIEPNLRAEPGALLRFCNEGEDYHEGFRRRLAETPGIIILRESDFDTALNIYERKLKKPPPAAIGEAIAKMRKDWKTPSDDVIISGLEMARHVKELAAGFFYRWNWPGGRPDVEWLAKRKTWRQCVRRAIQLSGQRAVGFRILDSEKPVETAVLEGHIGAFKIGEDMIDVGEAYRDWKEIQPRCDPKKQAVWVDNFLIEEIEQWIAESKVPGIVWTHHVAVMQRLRKRGHLVYGSAENGIVSETRTCVASIDAHKEGKNLQAFGRNLYAAVPSSGLVWEQSLGRSHRQGQTRDEVTAEVFLHSYDLWVAFENARSEARKTAQLVGTKPRLLRATIVVPSEQEIAQRTAIVQGKPVDPLWPPQNH